MGKVDETVIVKIRVLVGVEQTSAAARHCCR
jgi:hypothetical protein